MNQNVPAFAERNDCGTVKADQIIKQAVVIVGLVHQQVIAQTKRNAVKQELVYSQALSGLLPERHKQSQKDIEDIKSNGGHHPD